MELNIGVEQEFFIVKPLTLEMIPSIAPNTLKYLINEISATKELFQSQIELATKKCQSFTELEDTLKAQRDALRDSLRLFNLDYLTASSYPGASPSDIKLTDDPYYLALFKSRKATFQNALVSGLHIHVECLDKSQRIKLMYQTRSFLPLFLALSTSSPFFEYKLLPLQSYRTFLWESLPTSRFPPFFESYDDYLSLINKLKKINYIQGANNLYWHIRPGNGLPTLELRVCDIPPKLDDILGLSALYTALIHTLDTKDAASISFFTDNKEYLCYNLWQARNYSINDATFINASKDCVLPIKSAFEETVNFVEKKAKELGCLKYIESLAHCFEKGTSADRQRACYEKTHSIHDVQTLIYDETHDY